MSSASFGEDGWKEFTEAVRQFCISNGSRTYIGDTLGCSLIKNLNEGHQDKADTDLMARLNREVPEIGPFWQQLVSYWAGIRRRSPEQPALATVPRHDESRQMPVAVERIDSEKAKNLYCPHCGQLNSADRWPARGDLLQYFCQTARGAFGVPVNCPHCKSEWYVVWDSDPGPLARLSDVAPAYAYGSGVRGIGSEMI